jgi:acetyltransferase-like isoleucine patch superfamily enzyme
MHDDYWSVYELVDFGFATASPSARVSRKCSFYNITAGSSIGPHSRIDDFCILKGSITICAYVHIAAYSLISGVSDAVLIQDGVGLAARTSIFTATADYAADDIASPCAPGGGKVFTGPVIIGVGAVLGVNCVVLPNVVIGTGASIGSGCVIDHNVSNGGIVRAPKSATFARTRDWVAIAAQIRKLPL